MTIERRNPPGLHATPGYHHVTTVEARRMVFLAGQSPLDPGGSIAPGLLDQADQIVNNTFLALTAAGATPEDVVRTVIYVVSNDRADLSAVWDRLTASKLGPAFSTASTLLGVACLGFPGQLVELDVTAALADDPDGR
ncbi:RidA family protein [Amycolatopsis alkalitolerans]|uniref:RidA family protein n=1 Tax=Amycolatopsis alkalitolerans TaxID=2547244 RepID=A0A5C4LXX3_9PSEU|nr:RidA family protein [Amycolatopsis alkalitolerans]TNC24538.1 RidA family protein [Amycolatopsis alkalitolerans]